MGKASTFEAAIVIVLIVLVGLLYFAIVSTPQSAGKSWNLSLNGTPDYMFVGSDDTLYAFQGNDLTAIRKDGSLSWRLSVPGEWRILNDWDMPVYSSYAGGYGWGFYSYPIVDEKDGSLYLFAMHWITGTDVTAAKNSHDIPVALPAKVMKISPRGEVIQEFSFTYNVSPADIMGLTPPYGTYYLKEQVAIHTVGDRVYLFHDYTENVLDEDGHLLFSITNVSRPAAVDDQGMIYTVKAVTPSHELISAIQRNDPLPGDGVVIGEDYHNIGSDTFMLTGDTVEAHDASGSLLWSRVVGNITPQYIDQDNWRQFNTLPLLHNDILYIPVREGVVAVNANGTMLWSRELKDGTYVMFEKMPIDNDGNLYLKRLNLQPGMTYLVVISPGGNVSRPQIAFMDNYDQWTRYNASAPLGGNNGILYLGSTIAGTDQDSFENAYRSNDTPQGIVAAYNVKNDSRLWSFSIPAADRHFVILNDSNVNEAMPYGWGLRHDVIYETPLLIQHQSQIDVYPGNSVTYVNYYDLVYEMPMNNNRSMCYYARGFYAIDNNGRLLWEIPVDGWVSKAAASNSTIYYTTGDGKLRGTTVSIAAGLAFAAVAYLILRFFVLGTVARARGRLDQNANRNVVLRYVIDHPGVTAADAARDLRINLGTIRYHLFILALNHKVVTHSEGDKYLRYFTNAGTYSREERSLLSLMRRESLKKTLAVLSGNSGRSGPEIARELNVSTTAAHRHITELVEKGIVTRVSGEDRGYAYSIKDEYKPYIAKMIDRP